MRCWAAHHKLQPAGSARGFWDAGGEARGKECPSYSWLLNVFSINEGWLLVLQKGDAAVSYDDVTTWTCIWVEENKFEVLFSRTDGGFTNETILRSIDLRRIRIPDADGSTAVKSHWHHVSSLLSGWDSQFKGNEKVVGGKKHLWKQLCTYSFSVNVPFKYEKCYLYLSEIVECDMHKITKKA